jgi:hypothetical protein
MQRRRSLLLRGGLDLVTPAVAMPEGHCIAASNYEAAPEGYARIGGYERYDGRPEPHRARYWLVNFTDATANPAIGDVIEGDTSGATAVVIAASILTSGAFTDGDAAGAFVVSELSGDFQIGEDIEVSAVKIAEAASEALPDAAVDDAQSRAYRAAAIARRRTAIAAVPGDGPVRGVWAYLGGVYAFRDDSTICKMYRATAAGWVHIAPNPIVFFQTATNRFSEGATLSQGGVTAKIERAVTLEGSYQAGDAKGYLVLSNVAGGNFAAGAATDAEGGAADLEGAQTAPQIAPGGKFDFTNHNFQGGRGPSQMFFANGTGRAFQFSSAGDVLAAIVAIRDSALDKPRHVAQFQNHLFLGYDLGSVLFSSVGDPLDYRTTTGAGEINIGSSVTGFVEAAASALMIAGLDRVSYLTGTSAADFAKVELSSDSGAVEWTLKQVGRPIYLDDLGLRGLETTEAFGGFRRGTLTEAVEPLFRFKARAGVRAVIAMRVRGKDQYRLFWSDGSGVTVYLGRQSPEILPFELPVQVFNAASGDATDGNEILLLAAENGFVYRADVGTSFDGAEIPAFIRLAYNAVGAPYVNKRFHKATLEVVAGGDVELSASAEYSYGDASLPVAAEAALDVSSGGAVWNAGFWDDFYWSSLEKGRAETYLDGFGDTCSLAVLSRTDREQPHILTALTFNYTPRGMVR